MKRIIVSITLFMAFIVGGAASASVTGHGNIIQFKHNVNQFNTENSVIYQQVLNSKLMFTKGQICSREDNDLPVRCSR